MQKNIILHVLCTKLVFPSFTSCKADHLVFFLINNSNCIFFILDGMGRVGSQKGVHPMWEMVGEGDMGVRLGFGLFWYDGWDVTERAWSLRCRGQV